jgi:hypothetical protein
MNQLWLSLSSTVLVLVFRAATFKQVLWDAPLKHGPGYFLNIEVAQGFYEGQGARWLKRYHAVWVMELSAEALILMGLLFIAPWLLIPWWVLLPVWAGFAPVLCVAAAAGFSAYARARLGAHPPVHTSFAVPMEARPLRAYISWRREVLIAAITALCWTLLLHKGPRYFEWQPPIMMTYVILGLFPFKIDWARTTTPLPADRPAEHYEWIEAQRRLGLYSVDILRWMFLLLLADYALMHTWHAWIFAGPGSRLRWSLVGIALAVSCVFTLRGIRDQRRIADLGRSLRPVGSWATPFRPAKPLIGLTPWSYAWFGGLLLLLVFLRR